MFTVCQEPSFPLAVLRRRTGHSLTRRSQDRLPLLSRGWWSEWTLNLMAPLLRTTRNLWPWPRIYTFTPHAISCSSRERAGRGGHEQHWSATRCTEAASTVVSETVTETARPTLVLAKRATVTPLKHPSPPTVAVKCPRHHLVREEVQPKWPKKKPNQSALQDIRHLQTKVDSILAWRPFVHLIQETLFKQGPYKIQRKALMALCEVTEQHVVELFEGANLACMHRDRCTISPKDLRLVRCLRGDIEKYGEPVASEEARKQDRANFNKDQLTVGEAMMADIRRKYKLRALIAKRKWLALKAMRRWTVVFYTCLYVNCYFSM